ncbi:RNA-directed DNA polymerase, eukaryota, reverse transcriptase zinc-binding domain protein [Tanacetum coccineum]
MEAEILREYNIARQDEEKMLFQRAKIKWLSDGDKNSKYFHTVLKGRAHKSRIEVVKNENGDKFEGIHSINMDNLKSKTISDKDAEDMIRRISDKEIKEALYDICDNKAPGPDGYTTKFYKKAWDVVGRDVCEAIKEFFKNGKMLGEVNATLITLVPKSNTPIKVSDYRLIACCNVLYKIISKILTNRIKGALCKLVNPCQSAFIPRRQITNNFLLTQELLKGYNWENGARRMIQWIMVCVKTAGFTINVNNERVGYFKGGRGLRQGDPISPYIFTLVMEVFTLVMQKQIKDNGKFKFHWGCKELQLSPLCFADDLLVLCYGDLKSVQVVKQAMDIFSSISGLKPNIGKITVFFGNVKEQVKQEILDILPFNIGSLLVTYLGVPLITKYLTYTNCKCLIDKVKVKVNNWKNKLLSYAGRLQLIASILSSMQSIRKDGYASKMKLKDIISNGKWKWPKEWKEFHKDILKIPIPKLNKGIQDNYFWITNDKKTVRLSINKTWNDWREHSHKVDWCDAVWFSNCTPKHSFILWIAILGRSTTQDKLQKWYPDKQMTCSLCDLCPDSIGHLFFECNYSNVVWAGLKEKDDSLRNRRIFADEKKDSKTLIHDIISHLRIKLASLTVKRIKQVEEVCEKWKVYMTEKKGHGDLIDEELSDAISVDPNCSWCLDLSVNRSFTLVLVMPSIKASMFRVGFSEHKKGVCRGKCSKDEGFLHRYV